MLEFRHKRQELSLAELGKVSKADNRCQGLVDAAGVQDLFIWLLIDRKSITLYEQTKEVKLLLSHIQYRFLLENAAVWMGVQYIPTI